MTITRISANIFLCPSPLETPITWTLGHWSLTRSCWKWMVKPTEAVVWGDLKVTGDNMVIYSEEQPKCRDNLQGSAQSFPCLELHPLTQCPSHSPHCCLHSGTQELFPAQWPVHPVVSVLSGILFSATTSTYPKDCNVKSFPKGSLPQPAHSPSRGINLLYIQTRLSVFPFMAL